ncbi:Uncharacterized protein APZ42_029699 [Daphnia magna]|uniref:Uncharacterized protein n=1 Tax=Daphnia magna TaxID=35525 RepID=A0A164PDP7_9CRUS|nr:Uncharacterized protein APZ42_029699 [Daphnia magna]
MYNCSKFHQVSCLDIHIRIGCPAIVCYLQMTAGPLKFLTCLGIVTYSTICT